MPWPLTPPVSRTAPKRSKYGTERHPRRVSSAPFPFPFLAFLLGLCPAQCLLRSARFSDPSSTRLASLMVVARLMKHGKSPRQRIISRMLWLIQRPNRPDPLDVFRDSRGANAIRLVGMAGRRVGGARYQVPDGSVGGARNAGWQQRLAGDIFFVHGAANVPWNWPGELMDDAHERQAVRKPEEPQDWLKRTRPSPLAIERGATVGRGRATSVSQLSQPQFFSSIFLRRPSRRGPRLPA